MELDQNKAILSSREDLQLRQALSGVAIDHYVELEAKRTRQGITMRADRLLTVLDATYPDRNAMPFALRDMREQLDSL